MRSELVQTQEQKLIQQQRLTQQQMLQVRLLEMPLAELEQNVQMEIDDNPALETTPPEDDSFSTNEESTDSSESYEESLEREERADALDTALQNMGSDDEMPEMMRCLSLRIKLLPPGERNTKRLPMATSARSMIS